MWLSCELSYEIRAPTGRTSSEAARNEGIAERDMPAVLRQDLRACAEHFQLLGKFGRA
jgi:hypothetical protein